MIGSIDIKCRPLKLAFLVDPANEKQVQEAICISSTLWGGLYFPIIQLFNRTPKCWKQRYHSLPKAKDVILGYIDAFDPDVLVQLSKNIPQYVSDIGIRIIKPNDIWRSEDDDIYPQFGIGIFEVLDYIFKKHFRYKEKYPIKILFPQQPRKHSLFWASFFGNPPKDIEEVLKAQYYEPLEVHVPVFKIEDIGDILKSDVLFCRRIIDYGINHYGKSWSRNDAYVFVMDASNVQDIIDYWNLRALGKTVLPVPKQFIHNKELNLVVLNFLKSNRKHWHHNKSCCSFALILKSRGCSSDVFNKFIKDIEIKHKAQDPSNDPYFLRTDLYPRVWDECARDKDGAVPLDIYAEEESIDISDVKTSNLRFRSLLPKLINKRGYFGEPRCANDVNISIYGIDYYFPEVFPRYYGENYLRAISGFASLKWDWRVSRNGLVKLVKTDFNETQDISTSEKIFFAWLKDRGWEPELSPPGLLAKHIYKILNGHVAVLKNEKLLNLLERMNGGSIKKNGELTGDDKIRQERNLSVNEVKGKLKEMSGGRHNLHDYLVEKGMFNLGLKIQCPYCLRRSWYSINVVDGSFDCPKCLTTFRSIGNADNSVWAYKTAGPFSVPNYAEGAYTVLLTIEFLNRHKLSTIRLTPVTSFKAKSVTGKELESDFAAFWRDKFHGMEHEGLIFGECKTYGKFKDNDFKRMRYLAKTFPGAVLVFSTLRQKLTAQEIREIASIAKKGRRYWKSERPINPILILTGTELFNNFAPPYCWKDDIKEKYCRTVGLLDICNATQQIYLNLSSWETEWHEKWDKEHQRRLAKRKMQTIRQPVP